jgi:signal transduction histidine kinase
LDKTGSSLMNRYQRLIEISRDLASTLELDLLLNRITNAAAELTASEAAAILLYDETRHTLFFQASNNMDRPLMRGLAVPVESSIAGWILLHGKPVIVDDPNSDPRFFAGVQAASRTPTLSLLGVPLIVKNQVIGVLETINKIDGRFTDEDEEVLMTLGSQAAVAIENARLFTQSDLIAEMVHELRTPLASLKAAIHLLRRPEISADEHEDLVQTIQRETDRLSGLTADFLDLARLESGRTQFDLAEVDVRELVNECIEATGSSVLEAGLTLETDMQEPLPHISGDPVRLNQVLMNLVSNAIKYNRQGGSITLAAWSEGGDVYLCVRDTGPGIPEESIPHLFEKFYRVPGMKNVAEGTGLGLSIVYRIVQAHAGEITVTSEVGKGSQFTVRLPVDSE